MILTFNAYFCSSSRLLHCVHHVVYFPEVHSLLDIALIHNNARVGSQVACALSKQNKSLGGGIRTQKGQKMDSKTVSAT